MLILPLPPDWSAPPGASVLGTAVPALRQRSPHPGPRVQGPVGATVAGGVRPLREQRACVGRRPAYLGMFSSTVAHP